MANPEDMVDADQLPLQSLDEDSEDGAAAQPADLNTDDSFDNLSNIGVPEDERVETNATGAGRGESGAPKVLPRNEIKSRPEVSDSERKNMPKAASRFAVDPSVVGLSKDLKEETVQAMIQERSWTRSLPSRSDSPE
jgi:hypothetical protein